MKLKRKLVRLLGIPLALVLVVMPLVSSVVYAAPGEDDENVGPSEVLLGSIIPVVTETGFISLSIDGLGTNEASGIIQVEKPAGATVRSAYMAAASTGWSSRVLANGDVKINGAPVVWSMTTPSSIFSSNHWADVTSIVKTTIDGAPAGRVNFTITEVNTGGIDGEILAVIFNDPNQVVTNTIILLFGAQAIAGDTFNIGLAGPLNKSDPNLILDLSLGISFGFQPWGQFSIVEVNSTRMSSSAGGQDDRFVTNGNGALLTVGGLDDSNANPPPFAPPASIRTDDELYNLLPFVSTGDTAITVFTQNPSTDDNIYFAGLFLGSTIAIVGEGIVLGPDTDTNIVGAEHTVTATVQDDAGAPVVGRQVDFEIIAGPHAGLTGQASTNGSGQASFTYTGISTGTDEIVASFIDSDQQRQTSNTVFKEWIPRDTPPEPPVIEVGGDVYPVNKVALLAPWIALAAVIIAGATIAVRRRRTQS